ncbi:MAG: tryptophan 7-halogenase [Bacteroidia bacterium]|nr:tryptophan 7-halogenase [Bacteroidia bacterium]
MTPNTNLYFDIVIIGAGPAGCAAALAIRKNAPHLSVCLLESAALARRRLESLSPMTAHFLKELGIWGSFLKEQFQAAYGTSAIWGSESPHYNEFIYQTHGHGWQIPRNQYDDFLRKECVSRGAELFLNASFKRQNWTSNLWKLEVKIGEKEHTFSSKYVIDASGRNAAFTRQLGVRKRKADRLIGVYANFWLTDRQRSHHGYTLVEARDRGWWYSAYTNDNSVLLGWMSDSDLIRQDGLSRKEMYLEKLQDAPHTCQRVQNFEKMSELSLYSASSYILDQVGGPNWVAVGDTAAAVDPLSSSGSLRALRFGIIGAYVAVDHFKGRDSLSRYQKILSQEYDTYLQSKATHYGHESRWKAVEFWSRRQNGWLKHAI